MPDSTHTPDRRRRTRAALVALVSLAALGFASGWSPAPARADGDPASDVLASQSLFLPQDGGIPAAQQAQLAALLRSARRSGDPIRVALIATPADLGSVTGLWRRPQAYAGFLGLELSLIYRGTLLVAMPNGFGLYRSGGRLGADLTALDAARSPGTGASLGAAALAAVQRLAGAAGHDLTLPSASASSATSSGSAGAEAWLAFFLGAAVIAVAWAASLRARPPGLTRRGHDRVASPHGP